MRTSIAISIIMLGAAATVDAELLINLDYRYDSLAAGGSDFFGASNPDGQGATARAAIRAAADVFEGLLADSLLAIPTIDPSPSGGTPVWHQSIIRPGTGQPYRISSAANAADDGLTPFTGDADEFRDISIAADEVLIYVGGASLGGLRAGYGGSGVAFYGTSDFNDLISLRGKAPAAYATWGGYLLMDDDGSTPWHYDHAAPVPAASTDMYSTALHEIAHILGLNLGSDAFNAFKSGDTWSGPSAVAAWNRDNGTSFATIPLQPGDFHWADNTPDPEGPPTVASFVIGTTTLQEAAMDPSLLPGDRKFLTNVDAFALQDIGWKVVPEPASATLLLCAVASLAMRRR